MHHLADEPKLISPIRVLAALPGLAQVSDSNGRPVVNVSVNGAPR